MIFVGQKKVSDTMLYNKLKLFLICVILRLCCLFAKSSYYVADEYWQSLEVAHNLVFGYGYLTWEWIYGIRSYLYVCWIALLYKILQILSLDSVCALVWTPCIVQAIFSAISDFYFVAWSYKVLSKKQANWAVWVYFSNVFVAYCATRTLTNTIELNLTCIALYYYPWMKTEIGNVKYLFIVCLACIIRPTAAVVWLIPCYHALKEHKNPYKLLCFKYIPIGLFVLLSSTMLDSYLHGKLVFTWWNFIYMNVLQNISSNYSVQPMYWYTVIGLPVVLGPCVGPFFVIIFKDALLEGRSFDNVYDRILGAVGFSLFVFSYIPHKEFRFLLPLCPMIAVISSYKILEWTRSLTKFHTTVVTLSLLAVSSNVFYFLTQNHQVGTIEVMNYLAEPDNKLLFLMPCHHTPMYSHLHVNIPTRFLHCEPNVNNVPDYEEESETFYKQPFAWLEKEYPKNDSLPTHIICYDTLVKKIEPFLETRGYRRWKSIFHSRIVQPNAGTHVHIYNRTGDVVDKLYD